MSASADRGRLAGPDGAGARFPSGRAATAAAAVAAAWIAAGGPPARSGPAPGPPPLRLVDQPGRIEAATPAPRPPRPGGLAWSGPRLAAEWTALEDGDERTLRSPRLHLASWSEVESLELQLEPRSGVPGLEVLWSDRAEPPPSAELRNRRELVADGQPPRTAFLLSGDQLAYPAAGTDAPRPLAHLFLRFKAVPARVVRQVVLRTRAERLAEAASGRLRHTVAGETREALYGWTPARLSRALAPGGAGELSFAAASLRGGASVRYEVRLVDAGGERTLLAASVAGGSPWREFRVALPADRRPGRRLVLAADSDRPADVAFWGTPTLIPLDSRPRPPNVLLYVIDALRADRVGFAGHRPAATPVLDALAREGASFSRCYAQAAWTKPAVASLLTALYPHTHGVGARASLDALPDGVPTLQGVLRAAGYRTAQFTANPFASALSGLDRGFEVVLGPEAFAAGAGAAGAGARKIGSDDLNGRLLPWLADHAHERFFAYVHSIDPHAPLPTPRSPSADALSAGYDAAVAFNDAQLGRVREALRSLGLERDTLLVVTSDHGERLGEGGLSGHGRSVHESELRVPLLLARPGALAPLRSDAPVQSVDVMPTILGHAGIRPVPGRLQGRDLLAEAGPRPAFAARYVYPEARQLAELAGREELAVVDGRLKLTLRPAPAPGQPRLALHDVVADPGERHDLAASRPDLAAALEASLHAFLDGQRRARRAFQARHPDAAPAADRAREPLPEHLRERLRGLGYLR